VTISDTSREDDVLVRIAEQYGGCVIFPEHRDARLICDAAQAGLITIEVLRSNGKWRIALPTPNTTVDGETV
jgi:hypothetical protein